MTPIFFPFTYVSPDSIPALQACFQRLLVLQPVPGHLPAGMDKLLASGWLEVRAPLGADDGRVEEILRSIRSWAELNRGSRGLDVDVSQALGGRVPFFDDTSPSRIRDAVRSRDRQEADGKSTEGLVSDLVFLGMAEQFDIQTRSVSEGLGGLERMEACLFDQLVGEDIGVQWPRTREAFPPDSASADYMLAKRLAAWQRVATAVFAPHDWPSAAVTTSRSAVEALAEAAGGLKEAARIADIVPGDRLEDGGRGWRDDLGACLRQLVEGVDPAALRAPERPKTPPRPGRDFSMTLYAAAGVGLQALFAGRQGGEDRRPSRGGGSCAAVVLVEV